MLYFIFSQSYEVVTIIISVVPFTSETEIIISVVFKVIWLVYDRSRIYN